MEAGLFGVYAIKVTICLLLFFIFNKLLLSRETFHTLNRFVWLFVVVASLGLPLMEWTVVDEQVVVDKVDIPMLFDMEEIAIPEELEVEPLITLEGVASSLFFLYVSVVVILLVRMAILYLRLFSLILRKKSDLRHSILNSDMEYVALFKRCELQLGICREIHYIVHDHNIAPFSWMNYIVISREDLAENGHDIIIHELSHVKHYHSWDLLFIDLVTIFQWYNPASWLTKRELQQVHEYAADESVLNVGVNAKEYQLLLIKKAVGQRLYSMTNSFNHSKLKKRITMMLKKKSSKWAVAKSLYALPLAFFAVAAFANPEMSNRFDEISEVKVINFFENDQNTEDVISSSPSQKKDSPITQQTSTTIDNSGDEKDYNVKIVGYNTQAEDGNDSAITISSSSLSTSPDKKPLCFVDGKRYDGDIEDIDSSTVESMSVYKGESAKIYGQGSENGVIDIKLKKDANGDAASQVARVKIKKSMIAEMDSPNHPLYFVDGEKVDSIIGLESSKIKSINVLKGASAEIYGQGAENGVMLIELKKDADLPSSTTDQAAKFQGGNVLNFANWVKQNTQIPKSTIDKGAEARTSLRFTVDSDGSISSIETLDSEDDAYTAALIETMRSAPKWIAKIEGGKAVRSEGFIISLTHKLELAAEERYPDQPYLMVEKMPTFQGGDLRNFMTWVEQNVEVPKSTIDKGVALRSIYSFVIERDGSLSKLVVLKSSDAEFTAAAAMVIESSPKWTAGLKNGESVRVKYTIPVAYTPEGVKSISEITVTKEPMMMAEVMPKFQDGDLNDFRIWVSNNLVIPKSTLEKGEGCRVALSFVVERDGSVSSVKVLQTADKEFAEATAKVMESSPRWTPAQSKGKAVSVKYVLPVDYRP